jgi:hypothetical protein
MLAKLGLTITADCLTTEARPVDIRFRHGVAH